MLIESPTILLVDDDESAIKLMRVVFRRAGFFPPLQSAHDGVEAVAYLSGIGRYGDRAQHPLPAVMLLDLNMPRKNGFEVLSWVRQQLALKQLQVHILSSSGQAEDIRHAYDLGANSYLVKPGNLDGLTHLARCLVAWLGVCHFDSPSGAERERGLTLAPAIAKSLPSCAEAGGGISNT